MKKFLFLCAFFASGICFISGLSLIGLQTVSKNSVFSQIANGMGMYFIGNSIFIGAVLFGLIRIIAHFEDNDYDE